MLITVLRATKIISIGFVLLFYVNDTKFFISIILKFVKINLIIMI